MSCALIGYSNDTIDTSVTISGDGKVASAGPGVADVAAVAREGFACNAVWQFKIRKEMHGSEATLLGATTLPITKTIYKEASSMWLVRCFNGWMYEKSKIAAGRSCAIHQGDVVKFLLDWEYGFLYIRVNDIMQDVFFTGVRGKIGDPIYPACVFYGDLREVELSYARAAEEGEIPEPKGGMLHAGAFGLRKLASPASVARDSRGSFESHGSRSGEATGSMVFFRCSDGINILNAGMTAESMLSSYSYAVVDYPMAVGSLAAGSDTRYAWEFCLSKAKALEEGVFLGACTFPISEPNCNFSRDMWVVQAANGQVLSQGKLLRLRVDTVHETDLIRFELSSSGTMDILINGSLQELQIKDMEGEIFPLVVFRAEAREVQLAYVGPAAHMSADFAKATATHRIWEYEQREFAKQQEMERMEYQQMVDYRRKLDSELRAKSASVPSPPIFPSTPRKPSAAADEEPEMIEESTISHVAALTLEPVGISPVALSKGSPVGMRPEVLALLDEAVLLRLEPVLEALGIVVLDDVEALLEDPDMLADLSLTKIEIKRLERTLRSKRAPGIVPLPPAWPITAPAKGDWPEVPSLARLDEPPTSAKISIRPAIVAPPVDLKGLDRSLASESKHDSSAPSKPAAERKEESEGKRSDVAEEVLPAGTTPIYVRTLQGLSMELMVLPSDTALTVKKRMIALQPHMGLQSMVLIFAGMALEDHRTLAELNVYAGTSVMLVIKEKK